MALRPGYKQTEIGLIPDDWDAVPLAELFTFKNGLNKAKKFFGHGTPIVNYMDVFRHPGLRIGNVDGRVDVSKTELQSFEVRKGDVFFTRTSETVEEIGLAAAMLDEPSQTVFSGFVLRARPTATHLDNGFKAYCFSPRYFRDQVVARATYTTRALTNGRALSATQLAVPPLPEQHAIAGALADVDASIAAMTKSLAKKRDLRTAAMQQLITGEVRLPGFTSPWRKVALNDLAHLHKVQIMPPRYPTRMFQHFSLPAFDDGREPKYELGEQIGSNKFTVPQGAILVSKLNPRIPRVWSPAYIAVNAVASTEFLVLMPRDGVVRSCLSVFLSSKTFCRALEDAVTGTTGSHQRVNPQEAMRISFRWTADVAEQAAIGEVAGTFDHEIKNLEVRLAKTAALKQAMMQALLTGRVRLPVAQGGRTEKEPASA